MRYTLHVDQKAIRTNASDRADRPVLHIRSGATGQIIVAHAVEIVGTCRLVQHGPCSAHVEVDDGKAVMRAFQRKSLNGPLEPVPIPGMPTQASSGG